CALRKRCLGKGQRHRTLQVGEYYDLIQARRLEQRKEAFQTDMQHRNGIEGTISELVRAHGMRRCRYRGLAKARLQNLMIGAACNIKRWCRRKTWEQQNLADSMGSKAAGTIAA
ncbi:MAG: transposase, partial [Lentisphaerae bacterium]|nr:transposase [Lentisphaerota bacterium]